MYSVWDQGHHQAPIEGMRHRKAIWKWTKAYSLDAAKGPVSDTREWNFRPQFHTWPPKRRRTRTILWRHDLSAQEYSDFLRRARWKAYQATGR
jgi:hypothetical protein